jgi:hypothetical protein
MDCKNVQSNILEYTMGSLPDGLQSDIVRHLDGCRDCAVLAGQMQGIQKQIDLEKTHTGGPYFYTRLEQRLKTRTELNMKVLKPAFGWALTSLMVFFLIASLSGGILAGRYAGTQGVSGSITGQEVSGLYGDYYLNDSTQYELENLLISDNQ